MREHGLPQTSVKIYRYIVSIYIVLETSHTCSGANQRSDDSRYTIRDSKQFT